MGSNYSSGPFPDEVKSVIHLSLSAISGKIFRFDKTVDKNFNDVVFMSKKQFQFVLSLNDKETFTLFSLFDTDDHGRIPSIELWAALGLAADATVLEKIDFIFSLMDRNRDKCLNEIDLYVVIKCASRGFSKLKHIKAPPDSTIRKVVSEALNFRNIRSPENGEIMLKELRSFMMSHDLPRTYFSNLGNISVTSDAERLVSQRQTLLNELAEVEAEIDNLQSLSKYEKTDAAVYIFERGGDSRFIRLSESVMMKKLMIAGIETKAADKGSDKRLAVQRERRQRRHEIALEAELTRKSEAVMDAAAFSLSKAPRRADLSEARLEEKSADIIELAVRHKWSSLLPQDADGLVSLSVDSLEDLFEAAGITILDDEAAACLEAIRPSRSLTGRYPCSAVMEWFRTTHRDRALTAARRLPGGDLVQVMDEVQRRLRVDVWPRILGLISNFRECLCAVLRQWRLVDDAMRVRMKLKPTSNQSPNKPAPRGSNHADLGIALTGHMAKLMWQRRSLATSKGSKIGISAKFGKKPEEVKAAIGPDSKKDSSFVPRVMLTPAEEMKAKMARAAAAAQAERTKWKLILTIDTGVQPMDVTRLTSGPGDQDRHPLIDPATGLFQDMTLLLPKVLIEAYPLPPSAGASAPTEGAGTSSSGGMASWIAFGVDPFATDYEATGFMVVMRNFFESIPFEVRKDVYTHVFAEVLHLPREISLTESLAQPSATTKNAVSDGDDGTSTGLNDNSGTTHGTPAVRHRHPRHILIALIHERYRFSIPKPPLLELTRTCRDYWKDLEDVLPENFFASRSLRNLHIQLKMRPGLDALYRQSLDMLLAEERLFGPQEDELGDDLMNPLRFAKYCRQRKAQLEETSSKVPDMSEKDRLKLLQQLGLRSQGTRGELIARLQRGLRYDAEIVGYGELSKFGNDICRRIFQRFDVDNDGLLNLEEINELMSSTGCATFSDEQSYREVVEREELHCDERGYLTCEGLMRYYITWGRLWEDIQRMGFASPNDEVEGELVVTGEVDSQALESLLQLLEGHPLAQQSIKRIVSTLLALKDFYWDGIFPSLLETMGLGRILESIGQKDLGGSWINMIKNCLKTPDAFARLLHRLSESLADGDKGLVRMLRFAVGQRFGASADWGRALKQFFSEIEKYAEADADHLEGLQPNEKLNSDENISHSSSNAKDSTLEDFTEQDRFGRAIPGLKSEDRDSLEEKLQALLPPLLPSRELSAANIENLAAELSSFSRRLKELPYTKREREELVLQEAEMKQRLRRMQDDRLQCLDLSVLYGLIAYDAFRLYSTGVTSLGAGSGEAFLKMSATSVGSNSDRWRWPESLPEAMGEVSALKQKYLEKAAKSEARKKAAAAALEREQLRRNLATEERDKLRQLKSENRQTAYDEEEKRLFSEAYLARSSAREKKSGSQVLASMVDMWRGLGALRLQRYPGTLRAAVCQNNTACVLQEFYPDNMHGCLESLENLRSAATIIMDYLTNIGFGFGALVTRDPEISVSLEPVTAAGPGLSEPDAASTEPVVDPLLPLGVAPAALVVLLNYISCLKSLGYNGELVKTKNILPAVEMLENRLTVREREKFGLERAFEGVVVLTFADVREELIAVLDELELIRQRDREQAELERERAEMAVKEEQEAEEERRRLEEERRQKLRQAEDAGKRRKPVKTKQEKEAERDARKALTEERKRLYGLIRTSEIDSLFRSMADDTNRQLVGHEDETEKQLNLKK